MDDKLIYTPNYDKHNFQFCELKVEEKNGYSPFRGNAPEGAICRIFKMAFSRLF